jgi:hypothetical protein
MIIIKQFSKTKFNDESDQFFLNKACSAKTEWRNEKQTIYVQQTKLDKI